MDQARLQALTARGYAKAAQRIGAQTTQYRPASLTTPLASPHATFPAAFNRDAGFSFRQPTPWGHPSVFGLFDTSDVQAGDYLVCGPNTYFVARFEPFEPPICILCDRVVSLSGAGFAGDMGAACTIAGYDPSGGYLGGGTAEVATGWPCSILLHGGGTGNESDLPGALRRAEYEMLLPTMPGLTPAPYMIVSCDLGLQYTISAAEPTQYGTRCLMSVQQI